LRAALLADFVSTIAFESKHQPTCALNVFAADDPCCPPIALSVFSTPLLVAATRFPDTMPSPKKAMTILVKPQGEDDATSIAVPRAVLQRGTEELENNSSLLCSDGTSFLYL
jgi:hypothetical protein